MKAVSTIFILFLIAAAFGLKMNVKSIFITAYKYVYLDVHALCFNSAKEKWQCTRRFFFDYCSPDGRKFVKHYLGQQFRCSHNKISNTLNYRTNRLI